MNPWSRFTALLLLGLGSQQASALQPSAAAVSYTHLTLPTTSYV
mgnify:CR=1 FL=1